LIDGYIRWFQFVPHAKREDGTTHPSVAEENELRKIFEGLVEDGALTNTPTYGRLMKSQQQCNLGFFTYDQDPTQYMFHGKGMIFDAEAGLKEEGLFSFDSNDTPKEKIKILDFKENQLPNSDE